jgi:HlyD family secretion protein
MTTTPAPPPAEAPPPPANPSREAFRALSKLLPPPPAQESPSGPVDDAPIREIRTGGLIVALFFGVLGLWAAFAPLNAAVVAKGTVVVSGARQGLQHRDGGIVSKVNVREGQMVKKGDVMVELATTELTAQERALFAQLVEYQALRARLIAEQTGAPVLRAPPEWLQFTDPLQRASAQDALARQELELAARRRQLAAQKSVLGQRGGQQGARITGLQGQIVSADRQLQLIDEEIVGVRELLEKGLAPATRLRALERARADLIGRRGDLMASIEAARGAIGESRLQAVSVDQDRFAQVAEQLRAADMQLSEIAPRYEAVRVQLENARVRAPVDGVVQGLIAKAAGMVVRPGEVVVDVVPRGMPLVIDAQIRPDDADDLREGQKTEVRFTAFHSRDVPVLTGTVERVSADRFVDQRTGAAYFEARIVVAPDELARLEQSAARGRLKAGLPAEVIVPLRSRTALQYLFEPLETAVWGSFREH